MLDWYLKEWLAAVSEKGMTQAELGELTDYPKAKVSDLVTGKQRYNKDIINDVAAALNIEPFELLIPPERAMALRQLRESARKIVRVPFGGTAGDEPEEERKTA